jgi:hypothetical protein
LHRCISIEYRVKRRRARLVCSSSFVEPTPAAYIVITVGPVRTIKLTLLPLPIAPLHRELSVGQVYSFVGIGQLVGVLYYNYNYNYN